MSQLAPAASSVIENIENIAEPENIEDGSDLFVADLDYLFQHPIDLNKSTYEELIASGLFQPVQASNIIAHIFHSGWLYEKEELQAVDGIDNEFIRSVYSYITLSDPQAISRIPFKNLLVDADKYLLIRSFQTLEPSEGFLPESNYRYPGLRQSMYGKFLMRYGNLLSIGFTFENDAGEKILANKRIVDFFSWHAFVRGQKLFKVVAVGDYALRYGQGLTISIGQRAGLPGSPVAFKKFNPGILPYRSVNESSFLRGAAVSLQVKKIEFDVFLSSKKLDASIQTDSVSNYFNSVSESGFHRTESELSNRHTLKVMNSGFHTRYSNNGSEVGITYHLISFDIPKRKNISLYDINDNSGRLFQKVGTDFSVVKSNFQYFGEVSFSERSDMAMVVGITTQLGHHVTWSLLYRNYSSKFNELYSSPVSASSNFTGEHGITSGLLFKPDRFVEVNLLVDQYKMRWLTFSNDQPKVGSAIIATVKWKPARHSELYIRYRRKISAESRVPSLVGLKIQNTVVKYNLRIHYGVTLQKSITLRSRVEWVINSIDGRNKNGYMVFQDFLYKPLMRPYSFGLRYAIFNTDSYDERVYAYENDVLYAFSIPAFFNNGIRFYFLMRYKVSSSIDVWMKYAITSYSNIENIGSGYDKINGSKKSQLKLQARISF